MNIIEFVENKLSIFKSLYDIIRIVDPVKKKTIMIKDNKIEESEESCFLLFEKDTFCSNCISMRAYKNNDTFVKIEYDKNKIILLTATPVEINEKIYIVEILKDITHNGTIIHKISSNSDVTEELISSVNEKVIKDELTRVYNRRYINERLPVDLNYSKMNNLPLSIIMTDIDSYKSINDKYGHTVGDKILVDFSNLILKSIRASDWTARYGGDEFIIVLNDTNTKNAYLTAERIRKQLENTTFQYGDIKIKITSSFGVHSVENYNCKVEDLISQVDKNLYKAKTNGKNRTTVIQMDINNESAKDNKEVKLSKLNDQINEVRELLNEVCATLDEGSNNSERLAISKYLDELIVEYMKHVSKQKLNE